MSRIASEVGFVHLRVHSAYSLLEGALPIKRLAELAAADRMPALGIADTGNLFGALEFAEKMVEKGIQPIIGCQVAVDFDDVDERGPAGASRAQAAVRHRADRGQRGRLLESRPAGLELLHATPSRRPRRTSPCRGLADCADGLIALTGGPAARSTARIAAGRPTRRAPARRASRRSSATVSMSSCSATAPAAEESGRAASHRARLSPRGLPLVATNEPFFPTREDYEAHDALICIAEGAVIADGQPPPADAGALFQDARRDGDAVRRSAGSH